MFWGFQLSSLNGEYRGGTGGMGRGEGERELTIGQAWTSTRASE